MSYRSCEHSIISVRPCACRHIDDSFRVAEKVQLIRSSFVSGYPGIKQRKSVILNTLYYSNSSVRGNSVGRLSRQAGRQAIG